jgi:hypothetical protein
MVSALPLVGRAYADSKSLSRLGGMDCIRFTISSRLLGVNLAFLWMFTALPYLNYCLFGNYSLQDGGAVNNLVELNTWLLMEVICIYRVSRTPYNPI